jgi:hypothetical protein
MTSIKDHLRDALIRLKAATGTAEDVANFERHLGRIEGPEQDAASLLVSAMGPGQFPLLDHDIARGMLLDRLRHGDRQVRRSTSSDASIWLLAAPQLADALIFHQSDATPDREPEVWFTYPNSKGDEAELYAASYSEVRWLGVTLVDAVLDEVERLLAVTPQTISWGNPKSEDFYRLLAWQDLRRLRIGGGALDDAAFDAFLALPELRALELFSVQGATPERLERLKAHATLRSLRVDTQERMVNLDEQAPLLNRWGSLELEASTGMAAVFAGKLIPAAGKSAAPETTPERLRFIQKFVGEFPGLVATCVGGFSDTDVKSSAVAIGVPIATATKTEKVATAAIAEGMSRAEALPDDFWQTLAAATDVPALSREPVQVWLTVMGKRGDRSGHAATIRSPEDAALAREARTGMGFPLARLEDWERAATWQLSCGTQKW